MRTRREPKMTCMEFRGRWFLYFALAVGAATAHAQVATPANLPPPVSPPKVLSGDDIIPPQCAGVANAEVKVEFVVTTDGDARDIHVLESPSDKHSACAVETVRGYKFLPAMRDGNAVQIKMVLTISVKGQAA